MNDTFIYATTASFLSANAPKTDEQKHRLQVNERREEWLKITQEEIKKAAKEGLYNVRVSTKPNDTVELFKSFLNARGYKTDFDEMSKELMIEWGYKTD